MPPSDFHRCHPDLPPEGQVALTLREICSLTTEEIARLVSATADRYCTVVEIT
jgi:RNA polymerase sigma-70 factor (ECF subfamily)